MLDEYYIACALPHSLARDADFHVSLFFSPTIRPPAPTTLAASSLFSDWAAALQARPRIRLFDQKGDIACEPLLDPVNPELWRALFPPTTPVAASEVPRWEQRKWRSFSARNVHELARLVHLMTMYVSPTGKPRPDEHPFTRDMVARLGSLRQEHGQPDEGNLTATLDKIVEGGRSLATVEGIIQRTGDPVERVLLELHRCRRFYERPESQAAYRSQPDPGATLPPLEPARSEFHERCAMIGDHGELLRRLGLVVDLRVTNAARLRQSQWLSAQIFVGNRQNACRSPRVRCHAVGEALVSTPAGNDWADGALRLGDQERFSVLALDADGSALKVERYLWTLPRLLRCQTNGDPVDAASPALRSTGFTVAASSQAQLIQGQLERQRVLETGFVGNASPELFTEDIARGFRIEVWDDQVKRWASLHKRRSTASVPGFGNVYAGLLEEGFHQGTAALESPRVANSPIHVHEALFGWEGWSLSVTRPGKMIVHDDGAETLQDSPTVDDDELVHPVRIETQIAPATLPRLRFGREYAFRAWAVDLAGNSRMHAMKPTPPASIAKIGTILSTAPARSASDASAWAVSGLHAMALDAVQRRDADVVLPRSAPDVNVVVGSLLADPVLGSAVAGKLRTRGGSLAGTTAPVAQVQRRQLVDTAMAQVLRDEVEPFVGNLAISASARLAEAVSAQAGAVAGTKPNRDTLIDVVKWGRETVTALQPFLRWEPVSSPALVPRKRYTEGESLRELVVRSGVAQDPHTLELSITSPADYAAAANAQVPGVGYGAINERHLAPPKSSQLQAELHGKFDLAIGSGSAAQRRKMLGWALLENGTFSDTTRADIRHPPKRLAQPGIALVHVGTPTEALVEDLEKLKPGDPLAPGQTVVHDVDKLTLPYLPDPIARGVSISFPQAAQDRQVPFPLGVEDLAVAYLGEWPEIKPFRMKLQGGDELDGFVDRTEITFVLPAGDIQVLRLASSVGKDDLQLMGAWRSFPDSLTANPDVAAAAADGLLWGLTPYEDVRLVHAVDRPLRVPRPIQLRPLRGEGDTHLFLNGAVDVHGPSTDSLVAEAEWVDSIDDLSRDEPHTTELSAIAFRAQIRAYEDFALLGNIDAEGIVPGIGKISSHQARHQLHDTRHRVVGYRFRASTRFREYFAPALLAPAKDNPLDDGQSVIAAMTRVSVPSSARPAAPIVHSVIPLFRWSDATEPEQPFSRRHVRRVGVRIYLERPWFSSGNDELLGVLLAPTGNDEFGPPAADQSGFPFVSKRGSDPIWKSQPVPQRAMSLLELDSLLHIADAEGRWAAALPAVAPATLPLAALPGKPMVTVLGYKPQYNKLRKLWYVDVAIETGDAFWPFLRVAVCRYQPDSIDGCHLSAPVRCDFVQLPPPRTTSVSRTDDRHVRVVVAGPIGFRAERGRDPNVLAAMAEAADQHRSVVASLQRRDPAIASDLGWETVTTTRLLLRGHGVNDAQVAWVGELKAPEPIATSRPGSDPGDWRVMVEEWERLEADPAPASSPNTRATPRWERRLIHADAFDL